jgi:putative ABC transport system ATP-binding protein
MGATMATSKTPLQRLWALVLGEQAERADVGIILVYGAAVGVFSLVVPIAAQALVNTVAFNSLLQPILVLSLIVLVMLALASILRVIQAAVMERVQQRIFARVALDLAYRLPRVQLATYDSARGTELLNRFFEVLTVQKAAALLLVDGVGVVLQAAAGLLLLAFYHPILLAFDVVLLISITLILVLPFRKAVKTSIKESKAKFQVAGWLEEVARNPWVFKQGEGPRHALTRADEAVQGYLQARKDHFRVLLWQVSGTLLVQTLASVLLLGLGSVLVIRKQLTLGQLVAAELVVTLVVSGVAKLGKYLESLYDALASADKLGQLFDLDFENTGTQPLPPFSGRPALLLREVSFSYGRAGAPVLSKVNLEIQKGERVGIDGVNGSGKSTLLDLLVGARRSETGSIEVEGVDLRDLALADLRQECFLVREPEFFEGTLLENLTAGAGEISREQVREALERTLLWEEVASLPEGLATGLSGSKSPFSTGQARRFSLARALIRRPRFLLLDEAFEGVDPSLKRELLREIVSPKYPWTLILASHDPEELSFCTRILKIEGGDLVPTLRGHS